MDPFAQKDDVEAKVCADRFVAPRQKNSRAFRMSSRASFNDKVVGARSN